MKLIDQLNPNEKILWQGKKAKSVSFFESIFNSLMPFALIWALFDGFAIFAMSQANNADEVASAKAGIIGFFAFHLLPVWIYLAGILTSATKAKHTEYCVTDKGVYVQSGVFTTNVIMRPFSDMNSVTVKQSLFDKLFRTGDIVMKCRSVVYPAEKQAKVNGRPVRDPHSLMIENISDYESVLRLIQEHQEAAAAEEAAERIPENAFRGKFTAQMAPNGGMTQNTAAFQQQQYAQQQAAPAPQQFAQSAFGQPAGQQPMFSDPQRGFSAASGSFIAGGFSQPNGSDQNPGFGQTGGFAQPSGFSQTGGFAQPAPQPASFTQPATQQRFTQPEPAPQSFIQPTPQQKPAAAPVPHFSVPQQPQPNGFEMPKGFDVPAGFDMPDLVMPDTQSDFVDPTLSQAQDFRDPTLDYLDPNRPI